MLQPGSGRSEYSYVNQYLESWRATGGENSLLTTLTTRRYPRLSCKPDSGLQERRIGNRNRYRFGTQIEPRSRHRACISHSGQSGAQPGLARVALRTRFVKPPNARVDESIVAMLAMFARVRCEDSFRAKTSKQFRVDTDREKTRSTASRAQPRR
jgi:hypothetical protein